MAFVIAMAFVLSGITYVPKTTNAAEDSEVKVLGATLRLSKTDTDNNNQQSMRIGIEVPNASKTKSCQITVTVNGVSKVISTEPEGNGIDIQHDKILSYDKGTDTAVYAVVISGIKKKNFYTPIEITGQSADLTDGNTHTSTKESRNVMGVVNNLKNRYSDLDIGIDDNGNLIKKGGARLALSDLTGYSDTKPEQVTTEVLDLRQAKLPSGAKLGEDGSIVAEGDAGGTIDIPLSRRIAVGETIKLHITGSVGEGNTGFRCWPAIGVDALTDNPINTDNDKIIKDDKTFDFTKEIILKDFEDKGHTYADIIMFKAKSWDSTLSAITIKSVSVTYLGNSDPAPTATPEPTPEPTPKPTPNPEAEDINVPLTADTAADKGPAWIHGDKNTYNDDGSVISNIKEGDGTYFYFNADRSPINLVDYDKMIVTLSSDVNNTPIRLGIITDGNNMNPDAEQGNSDIIDGRYITGTTDTELEFNIVDNYKDKANKDKGYGALIALPGNWNWWGDKVAEANITIKSIKLVAHKEAPATYTMDLQKYRPEVISYVDSSASLTPEYNADDKSITLDMGPMSGAIFTDIPSDAEYKYAKITYQNLSDTGNPRAYCIKKSDGSDGASADIKNLMEETITLNENSNIKEVKIFNLTFNNEYSGQTSKVIIKSITLYKESPTTGAPDI